MKNERKADESVPGPGAYNIPDRWGKEGLHWTLKPKLNNLMFTNSSQMPGPGTYEVPQSINKTGNYFNSKFKSSQCGVFSPARSTRFSDYKNNRSGIPGPGTYSPGSAITKDGNYFLSKFKSSNCRTFYHYNRDTMSSVKKQRNMPGPGMYRLPSEFGYYESSKKPSLRIRKKKRRARSVEEPRQRISNN